MPRTKIIGTIGPASSDYSVLRKMFAAGLDVVRLNFSHGSVKEHLGSIELVRRLNSKYRRHIRIMQDLEGFRIRVGRFKGSKTRLLKNRTVVWLTNPSQGRTQAHGPRTIPFDYKGDLSRIQPMGDHTGSPLHIYIDDGNLVLRVKSTSANSIKAVVVEGGILKERKGINIPGLDLEFEGITEKDKKDIEFGIKHKVDYIALSFVRDANDVKKVRELIKPRLPNCRVVAKIESREAIENIDGIIDAADGIMIARGDMGVAVPIYEVPIIQKRIIKKCNGRRKFVITATQMLEHMTEHSRPTRAEVTDVANAIIDGTDFVMLSSETAVGLFPHQSVLMMNEIIKFTEKNMSPHLL
ncbi:MAG TPA: pyruvate kinase [Planctomycetes bacterium]|nr:pyruvate kinase [Planctomycetota bacterium]